jgi:hypothetical protein
MLKHGRPNPFERLVRMLRYLGGTEEQIAVY